MLAPLYTSEEMKAAEAGHDVPTLMERAGHAVADEAQRRFPRARRFALYAGTGALGIEALSRGAESAELVEAVAVEQADLRTEDADVERADQTTDEVDADDVERCWGKESIVQGAVCVRRLALEHRAERDASEIGIDQQRLTLEGQPVAGRTEPFELETPTEREARHGQVSHRGQVGALALFASGHEAGKTGEVLHRPQGAHVRISASNSSMNAGDSAGRRAGCHVAARLLTI